MTKQELKALKNQNIKEMKSFMKKVDQYYSNIVKINEEKNKKINFYYSEIEKLQYEITIKQKRIIQIETDLENNSQKKGNHE